MIPMHTDAGKSVGGFRAENVLSPDSRLFGELNVEYMQKNKGELTSKVPDT